MTFGVYGPYDESITAADSLGNQDYANDLANTMFAKGQAGQGRTGPQAFGGMGQLANDFANGQANSAYLRSVMNGSAGPSLAQQQLKAGVQQSQLGQEGLGASARGGGQAFAAAKRAASDQSGLLGQQGIQQGQQLAATEQLQARNAYGMQQNANAGIANALMSAGQFNTQLGMQQRGLNDQYQIGEEGLGMGAHNSYLQAQGGMAQTAMQRQMQLNQQRAQTNQQEQQMALSAMMAMIGAASDVRLKRRIERL